MIVAIIIACEIGFWLILAAGLGARYVLRQRVLGAVLLACVPVVDLVLLVAATIDLRDGATANWTHGLAAAYLGLSIVLGTPWSGGSTRASRTASPAGRSRRRLPAPAAHGPAGSGRRGR